MHYVIYRKSNAAAQCPSCTLLFIFIYRCAATTDFNCNWLTNREAALYHSSIQNPSSVPMNGEKEKKKGLNKLKEPENSTMCHK